MGPPEQPPFPAGQVLDANPSELPQWPTGPLSPTPPSPPCSRARGLGKRPLRPLGQPSSLGQWAEWGLQLGSGLGRRHGWGTAASLTPVRPHCRGTRHWHWHWHCPGRPWPSRWGRGAQPSQDGHLITQSLPPAPQLRSHCTILLQARLALPAEAASPMLCPLFLCERLRMSTPV